MGSYLTEIQKAGIEPNFYCSPEYLARAGAEEQLNDEHIWMEEAGGGHLLFPALRWHGHEVGFKLSDWTPPGKDIWSDFAGWTPSDVGEWTPTFLDYEYKYNPLRFKNMEGKKWKTFRKNVRKWPLRRGQGRYETLTWAGAGAGPSPYDAEIGDLLLAWILDKGTTDIHDGDVMVDFVQNGYNRAVLIHPKDGVVGINVWDYTYCSINFRYSIARPGEPFLSDYLRLLFYLSIAYDGRMVNDGGSLDIPSLDKYKRKLNPSRIRTVNTWRRK